MSKIYSFLFAVILLSANGYSQLTGIKTIPGDYASIKLAVDDLNAVGVGAGGVIFNVTAGFSEPAITATIALTATGTAANPIVFQKAGAGANPLITAYTTGTATAGTTTSPLDGLFRLQGSDYVTIDGIDLQENAANTTAATMMEYGYGLFKASATDGCQNDLIKNCTVTLNRNNVTLGTAESSDGSCGIWMANTLGTNNATITPTATSGLNSNNKFYTNTIQNSNVCVYLRGFAAVSPYTLYDQSNDVGGSSLATGNTFKNYGGGTSASAITAYALRAIYQAGFNYSYNTINNNDGAGVNHAYTLRGIFQSTATSQSGNINNNTVTLKGGGTTTSLLGIDNAGGSTANSNTININNNTVQNSTYTTATTGAFSGITNSSSAATVNMNGNTINNNTIAGTGIMTLLEGGSPGTISMSNNIVTNNSKTGPSGTFYCSRINSAIITYSGNEIHDNSITSTTASASIATLYGYYNLSTPTLETYTNNQIYNLTISTASSVTGSILYGIQASASGSSQTVSGNTVHSLTFTSSSSTGTAAIRGMSHISPGNFFKNKIYNLSSSGPTSTVVGLYIGSGTQNAFNNLIGDLKAPTSTGTAAISGIQVAGGTAVNVHYNTVYLNASSTSATTFGTSALYVSSLTPAVTSRNNILINTSSSAGGWLTAAFRYVSFPSTSVYTISSNNNLFYAGTPSATNVIYVEGTTTPANSKQDLPAYKTYMVNRDQLSVTENTNFMSTTGSSANFLHIAAGSSTLAESAGINVTGVTDDFDAQVRQGNPGYAGTGIGPDIGADEFEGTNPSISALDMGATGLVAPGAAGCYGASETVTISVKNYGTATINFSVNPVTVTTNVTGAATQTLTVIINTGTLAPGASQNVNMSTTLNMSAGGTYTFNAATAVTGDGNATNDAMGAASRTVTATVALPQSIDFTGFTGANLTTLFPNWYEATGTTVPSGTTSAWTNQSSWSPTNTTARINLYTTTRNEWIVGPKFVAAANTALTYSIAITDFGTVAVDPDKMTGTDDKVVVKISTNCGQTFTDLLVYNAANTGAITNVLVPQTIDLSAYAGQQVIIAFYASDGPIDDLNDYDFHIDNIQIKTPVATDISTISLIAPATGPVCYGATETVTIAVKNTGTSTINFSTNSLTVTTQVTGAATQTLSATINTGTLAVDSTMNVTMSTTLNMTAFGTYTFNANSVLTGDGTASNDAMPATTRTVVAPVTLPQSIDFTGFTGANLTTVFPNWYEATGTTFPSGTTSVWTNQSSWSPTNTTAKINLYTTIRNEWIVGPKFVPVANTALTYSIAITDFNSVAVDPDKMTGTDDKVVVKISTNCGQTFTDLLVYNAANTGAISNVLVPQTIDLSAYAGQQVIIAFYASDGPIDDLNDYDFHIDNIRIATPSPTDIATTALAAPLASTNCYGATEPVSITVKNAGTAVIDFAVNPLTVTTKITGAITQTLSATVNTGTLAVGASTNITMSTTANMGTVGTYTFNAYSNLTGDGDITNDTLKPAVVISKTFVFTPIASGDWTSASTWCGGIIPGCADTVNVPNGINLTVNAGTANSRRITVATGGTLTVSGSTLTVGCTLNNAILTNNGTLTVSGGTLAVNGNVLMASGSTFNQSAGSIVIDGNDGTLAANSVASGTAMLLINSPLGSVTGGSITIVDPNYNSSGKAFDYNVTSTAMAWGTGHTLIIGNGTSTDASANTSGFILEQYTSTGKLSIGNLRISGGTGTNRWASLGAWSTFVNGTLTVDANSEFRINSASTSAVFTGNIVNDGTITSTVAVTLGATSGNATVANTNPQSIGGSGVFRNLVAVPTANLTSLLVNNTSSGGVTLNVPLSVSGTLTLTSGVVVTTATNVLTLGTSPASLGTLSRTSGFVKGPFRRYFAAATTAFSASASLLPVGGISAMGGATVYYPAEVAFTTAPSTGGVLTAEYISANAGNAGLPQSDGAYVATDIYSEGYWRIDNSGITGGTYGVRITGSDFSSLQLWTANGEARVIKRASGAGTWGAFEGTHTNGSSYAVQRDGLTTFSEFAITKSNVILPITLQYFKGAKTTAGNAVEWKVNCTSARVTMEIERSADARNFNRITSVTADQVRCNLPFYFTDAQPLKAINYYRLKMIDMDGKISYSAVIAIINGDKGIEIVGMYPTVVSNSAFLSIAAAKAGKIQTTITDMSGRLIQSSNQSIAEGSSLITVDCSALSAGVYHITGYVDGARTKTIRFIKL